MFLIDTLNKTVIQHLIAVTFNNYSYFNIYIIRILFAEFRFARSFKHCPEYKGHREITDRAIGDVSSQYKHSSVKFEKGSSRTDSTNIDYHKYGNTNTSANR